MIIPPRAKVGDQVQDLNDWRAIMQVFVNGMPQYLEFPPDDLTTKMIVLSRKAEVQLGGYDPEDHSFIVWNGNNWEVW